jgi:putative aldouronate transport system substrate-binding protein
LGQSRDKRLSGKGGGAAESQLSQEFTQEIMKVTQNKCIEKEVFRMKKTAILIISSILATSLAGCTSSNDSNNSTANQAVTESSNFNKTGLPIVKEPITVRVMYPRDPVHGDFEKMWFIKELAKKTNINLKIEAVESAGWEEKKSLAFATGDLPDIFLSGLTAKDENMYGPQKLLLPLNDLIDNYAPLTKELITKYPEVTKTFTFEDGSIYDLPAFVSAKRDLFGAPSYINKQWIQNLGLSMPKNLDELYTVLKAFKEKDPNQNGKQDEIPISGLFKGNTKMIILSAVGFADPRHDVKNGKYVYVPLEPAYKEYLSYMNKLFTEGILDKEYFTQTIEQLLAKESGMRMGLYADGSPQGNIKGEGYKEMTVPGPLTSSINQEKVWRKNPQYLRLGTFAITNKAKNPEALIRLLDFLYTDEGTLMGRTGPELGKWDGKGGYEWADFNGVKAFKVHYDGFNSYFNFRGSQTLLNVPIHITQDWFTYTTHGDERNKWYTDVTMNSGRFEALRLPYPEVKFKPEEQEKIASFIDMDSYVDQMEAKFIMGETPLSQWDSYTATLKKMGSDEMSKIRQQAYDRWNKSGK